MRLIEFLNREALENYLLELNYDHGLNPEMACIDNKQQAFLACGTEEGDSMGIAFYLANSEGYMYHYGVDGTEYDLDKIRDWAPSAFPVHALAPTDRPES